MLRRQTSAPRQWLIVDRRTLRNLPTALRALPRGSGLLVILHDLPARDRRRLVAQLRLAANARRLRLVDEASRVAARVHDPRELRRALLASKEFIFLSPIYATRSHPGWQPLPRMRAAALARMARRRLLALGGMDAIRFARVERLGFAGWGGIDAWKR